MDKRLRSILSNNKDTVYGKTYNFSSVKTTEDYQKYVPVTTYDDYTPYIERIAGGGQNVLTKERVIMFEPSSGSTSAKKLIPYTKGLKKEFLQGILPWLWDLNKNFPKLKYGKVYFSITPPANEETYTKGGIPIGFEGDEEYLGRFGGYFIGRKFCVPNDVKRIKSTEEFMYTTLFHLLLEGNLRLISIWNPTFLTILMDKFTEHRERLVCDVAFKNKNRAKEIADAEVSGLWPKLQVISCWADGNSKTQAENLKRLFPNAYIQPKGLLATEGIMTIPIEGVGKRLTRSHFFEFQDAKGNIYLKDELRIGDEYDVILTTSGGLYRYKIGDVVLYKGNQCFDFIGKSGNVSDYFGEKLNENHIRQLLQNIEFTFCMLALCNNGYVLYVDDKVDVKDGFADALEGRLRENFHYDYCRKLEQLQKLRVFRVKGNANEQYVQNCIRFGQRIGDIKPILLSSKKDWIFKGDYL